MAPVLIATDLEHSGATPPSIPWRRRWRVTLLGAFALVVGVLAAMLAADLVRHYREARASALDRQAETAQALARATELFVARHVAVARSAHEAFEEPLEPDARRRLLRRLRRAHPEVTGVDLVDPRGTVVEADPRP